MASVPTFPPVRACLFDMDGLLIDTEDIYTDVTNQILKENNRPLMPWSIKAQLQGRPNPASTKIFMEWAQLPITLPQYRARLSELHSAGFPACAPLPGVPELLATLHTATSVSAPREPIEIALATSSAFNNFKLKTGHLQDLFKFFPSAQQVVGDDPRVALGRGKPAPDIYLVALETINARRRSEGKDEIRSEECLVFEDSVPGVESGRRAGMRVVWVPHVGLLAEFKGMEGVVLAGATEEGDRDGGQVGDKGTVGVIGDGGGELRTSLVGFDYDRYGIIPSGSF